MKVECVQQILLKKTAVAFDSFGHLSSFDKPLHKLERSNNDFALSK